MTTHVSRWGEYGPRPAPLEVNSALFGSLHLSESIQIACTPAAAWNLVCDITRIGEFSPECIQARWLEGAQRPSVGARFEGTNRVVAGDDELLWIRPCTVTSFVLGESFAYTVGDRYDGTAAGEWGFRITPAEDGTTVTQTFTHLPDGLSGLRSQADADPDGAAELVGQRVGSLQDGMRLTLERMRVCLEGDAAAPAS